MAAKNKKNLKNTRSRKVATPKKKAAPKKQAQTPSPASMEPAELPFGKMNYILLGIGVLMIAIGFFLMTSTEFVDATEFSLPLHVAPIFVVAGFVEIIFAIMYKPKGEESEVAQELETSEA